jgi:uncharacterized protein
MDGKQPVERSIASYSEVSIGSKNRGKLKFSVDFRYIIIALLLIMAGMLIVWKPWAQTPVSNRTVSVTGEATLQAKPDEYVFTPSYDFTNADKQVALDALAKQSDTIVAKLKSLGVTDSQIKTNSTGGQRYYSYVANSDNSNTYTLQLTITVDSSSLAQKTQDYLTTTSPSGAVSPQVNFSDAKQNSLNNQARDVATKDARAKAEQSAKNLGFKLGAVKSVADNSGFGRPMPLAIGSMNSATTAGGPVKQPILSVQPGQNKLTYSVDVVYYIH